VPPKVLPDPAKPGRARQVLEYAALLFTRPSLLAGQAGLAIHLKKSCLRAAFLLRGVYR
jgi:hypothetical protein